jgi:predicted transcriptional regulator
MGVSAAAAAEVRIKIRVRITALPSLLEETGIVTGFPIFAHWRAACNERVPIAFARSAGDASSRAKKHRRKTRVKKLLTTARGHASFLAYARKPAGTALMQPAGLSRRERQIMEVLYRLERASVAEVQKAIEDAPGYSAMRALLRTLEEKGHVKHEAEGLKYVYTPVVAREKAKRSALKHLLDTFFSDSPDQIVAALLDVSARQLTQAELDRMAEMIEKAKKEGK